jgi:hypothetical protein
MLRSLAVIPMGKQHHKPILYIPFSLPRRDELIDDNLCAIREVTELCLPKGQCIWMSLGVSKLISKDGEFREMRVGSYESSSSTLDQFFRNDLINWVVVTIGILIKHMSMSMTECSSFNILPR